MKNKLEMMLNIIDHHLKNKETCFLFEKYTASYEHSIIIEDVVDDTTRHIIATLHFFKNINFLDKFIESGFYMLLEIPKDIPFERRRVISRIPTILSACYLEEFKHLEMDWLISDDVPSEKEIFTKGFGFFTKAEVLQDYPAYNYLYSWFRSDKISVEEYCENSDIMANVNKFLEFITRSICFLWTNTSKIEYTPKLLTHLDYFPALDRLNLPSKRVSLIKNTTL